MKKVKIAFWIVIFGLVGLLIFQNKEFFMAESRLIINLGIYYYQTPLLANAIFFVAFFLVGILISYFLSLFRQFRDAKTIRTLKAKESSLVETVSALEKELSSQKVFIDPAPKATMGEQLEPVETTAELK